MSALPSLHTLAGLPAPIVARPPAKGQHAASIHAMARPDGTIDATAAFVQNMLQRIATDYAASCSEVPRFSASELHAKTDADDFRDKFGFVVVDAASCFPDATLSADSRSVHLARAGHALEAACGNYIGYMSAYAPTPILIRALTLTHCRHKTYSGEYLHLNTVGHVRLAGTDTVFNTITHTSAAHFLRALAYTPYAQIRHNNNLISSLEDVQCFVSAPGTKNHTSTMDPHVPHWRHQDFLAEYTPSQACFSHCKGGIVARGAVQVTLMPGFHSVFDMLRTAGGESLARALHLTPREFSAFINAPTPAAALKGTACERIFTDPRIYTGLQQSFVLHEGDLLICDARIPMSVTALSGEAEQVGPEGLLSVFQPVTMESVDHLDGAELARLRSERLTAILGYSEAAHTSAAYASCLRAPVICWDTREYPYPQVSSEYVKSNVDTFGLNFISTEVNAMGSAEYYPSAGSNIELRNHCLTAAAVSLFPGSVDVTGAPAPISDSVFDYAAPGSEEGTAPPPASPIDELADLGVDLLDLGPFSLDGFSDQFAADLQDLSGFSDFDMGDDFASLGAAVGPESLAFAPAAPATPLTTTSSATPASPASPASPAASADAFGDSHLFDEASLADFSTFEPADHFDFSTFPPHTPPPVVFTASTPSATPSGEGEANVTDKGEDHMELTLDVFEFDAPAATGTKRPRDGEETAAPATKRQRTAPRPARGATCHYCTKSRPVSRYVNAASPEGIPQCVVACIACINRHDLRDSVVHL